MRRVDFNAVLMQGMLSFLLFAGALHVDLADLLDRKWAILSLATVGVVLSTFMIGFVVFQLFRLFGAEMPFIYALLFGALISPTDPIAVLGVLKSARAPKKLEITIIGESLFNDGVGVVVFAVILGVATGGHEITGTGVLLLFVEEALGGALLGLVLGYVSSKMLAAVDNYSVEILLTLALVAGGYALAGAVHASGPIAMVVAGLLIGNHGRLFSMSDLTRERLDNFWELIDEVLNSMLFVMIGLEVLILTPNRTHLAIGLLAIPLVLLVRYVAVGLPLGALRSVTSFAPHIVKLMTWGGVRGGISIALALSIPPSPPRDAILLVTYCVVVFSILVQGLTVGRAVRWALAHR